MDLDIIFYVYLQIFIENTECILISRQTHLRAHRE